MKTMGKGLVLIVLGAGAVLSTGCASVVDDSTVSSMGDVVLEGRSDIFAVPFDRYAERDESLPIGVFDSGIGGLTVLNEVLTIDRFDNRTHAPGGDGLPDFSDESFIYLGDQANMPYGNYPAEDKVAFLKELILKDVVFLLGDRYWTSRAANAPRRDKPPVKAIVIACNTATAYGLDDIENALQRWKIPIFTVGVVAAGADGAIAALGDREAPGAVAVMATVGTCRSEGYVREIDRSSNEENTPSPAVVQQGCLGLAGAIEGSPEYVTPPGSEPTAAYRGPAVDNAAAPIERALLSEYGFDDAGILGAPEDPAAWQLNSIDNYIRYHTTTMVEDYRRRGSTEPITTVILGCTHFPFHQDTIEASFDRLRSFTTDDGGAPYEHLIAEEIDFVDPAHLTAVQLYEALASKGLLVDADSTPADEFYISVPNATCPGVELRPDGLSFVYDYKYGRSTAELEMEYVKRVPMSRENLGDSAIDTIRTTMPAVWERLVSFSSSSPRCDGLSAASRIDTVR